MAHPAVVNRRNLAVVKALTYVMFAMFAMTTDSVGIIIPEVIKTFQRRSTAAGTFQYATMAGIALAALFLGQLADRLGRRHDHRRAHAVCRGLLRSSPATRSCSSRS
jgi:fucose permease